MFRTDSWQSHDDYRRLVNHSWDKYKSGGGTQPYEIQKQKLLNLNLDPVGEYLSGLYSHRGAPAKNQAQILRSLVLFVMLFNMTAAKCSLTLWVRDVLPASGVLVTLVGCESAETLPPLGSYYDFMNRLWSGDRSIYSRSHLMPAGKNRKGKKDVGPDGKLRDEEQARTKDLADSLIRGEDITDGRDSVLHSVLFLAAVLPSFRLGLISQDSLTMSGDGTAVPSHATPYGHLPKSPGILAQHPDPSECPRHYPDPDAGWGYDSGEKGWFFGRSLYILSCHNKELRLDLPLLPKFMEARRHDSISFLHAFDDFLNHDAGISPRNVCLDSAHDNMPTYRLMEHFGINSLIDINGRSTKSDSYQDDISFDKDGHPCCRAGHEMAAWGNDPRKDARKYRCPLKCGRVASCPHEGECSPGSYGRTVYVKEGRDLRFNTRIPRDSQQYKDIYSERTASERVNTRVLNDYRLQFLKIRGDDHFAFWTMLICICIHLDARAKAASLFYLSQANSR